MKLFFLYLYAGYYTVNLIFNSVARQLLIELSSSRITPHLLQLQMSRTWVKVCQTKIELIFFSQSVGTPNIRLAFIRNDINYVTCSRRFNLIMSDIKKVARGLQAKVFKIPI